uniref:Zf-C3H1 domain-containing protein n=1 Tax=Macrostomum lignano TaxID=282301 RepID=A0A1I8JCA6_9PLAT
MSDGETVSSNSNQSQCDFYIESDATLLQLREAALESARERRAAAANANSVNDKDLLKDETHEKEDDDMDVVDSPSPVLPDSDMIGTELDHAVLQMPIPPSPERQLPDEADLELEEGEYCSDNVHSPDSNQEFDNELARLADLAEWVVVDECEDALENLDKGPNAVESETNDDAAVNDNAQNADEDDEEELLALRELLISNLRARASAKESASNKVAVSSAAVDDADNAKSLVSTKDQNIEEPTKQDEFNQENLTKLASEEELSTPRILDEVAHSQFASVTDFPKEDGTSDLIDHADPLSATVDSALQNFKQAAHPRIASMTEVVSSQSFKDQKQETRIETSHLNLTTVASAPNVLTIPTTSSQQQQQQQNRRRVVGLSSQELKTSSSTGVPTRRFVICLGDSDSDSTESESEALKPAKKSRLVAPPVAAVPVDDRARLQSLRHSVRDRATRLRVGLAAGRQELQQRREKLAQRIAELNEKRNAAARLRLDARRALELCAQLRKRSQAADAELRRLEASASKEQQSLRARETAFKARESRVLAALDESNLLRRVCPPTSASGPPLDPFIPLCPFGLHGSCRDPSCEYQHLPTWQSSDKTMRGLPNTIASTTNSNPTTTTATLPSSSIASTTSSSTRRNHRLAERSVSVKDYCDACERYVTVSGAHLRDDPRCQSCRPISSPEQAIAVLHHFLCRLRSRQSAATIDSRDCVVSAAEAFANESTGQFPNHVGLVLHSLELRRLAKRPVPVALLKTLLNRVPHCGIVRRALRLQPDFIGQRQLLEFAFALPELQRTASSLDLLQLALSHCRLMYLNDDSQSPPPQVWPSGPPTAMLPNHAAFLQLYRLYWALTGSPPELPLASLRSETALLTELPIFVIDVDNQQADKLSVNDLRQLLIAAGIFEQQLDDKDATKDSIEKSFTAGDEPKALASEICDWLIGPEPSCPFRHRLVLLVAQCLACKSSDSSSSSHQGVSAIYRLLAIRRSFLPALMHWLSSVFESNSCPSSGELIDLLHNCGATCVTHWPDLAHSAVNWILLKNSTTKSNDEAIQLLSVAVSASYNNGGSIADTDEGIEVVLKRYEHLLGLLDPEEALKFRSPIRRSLVAMETDAQLFVAMNYARVLKMKLSKNFPSSTLIDLASRLSSPLSGVQLLTFIVTETAEVSADLVHSLCRELRPLLRSPCPAMLSAAAAKLIDSIDWKQIAPLSVSELTSIVCRAPDSLPLLRSVCSVLTNCDRLPDACALCLDCAKFHQPTSPAFWLDLSLQLLQTAHPGAVRPQLDLLERGLQLLPLCRRLWLTAVHLAESAGLHRTVDRLRAGMATRLGAEPTTGTSEGVASALVGAKASLTNQKDE